MGKVVTIIGSREITEEQSVVLAEIATFFKLHGYTLRSGGASGSDSVGERVYSSNGVLTNAEIFLPFDGFRNKYTINNSCFISKYKKTIHKKAEDIAKVIHPAWHRLDYAGCALHTRNVFQILGINIDNPTDLVVYCANEKNRIVSGGTATAVTLARVYDIPTYNINLLEDMDKLITVMNNLNQKPY